MKCVLFGVVGIVDVGQGGGGGLSIRHCKYETNFYV